MGMVETLPKVQHMTDVESSALEATFGPDGDFDMMFPEGAFEHPTEEAEPRAPQPRSFADVKAVPVTIYTDGNTATQVLMLLEMLRYCMEGSREVLDTTTGEAKEYKMTVRVRNRGKTDFMVSVGDETLPPIPLAEDDYFVGS